MRLRHRRTHKVSQDQLEALAFDNRLKIEMSPTKDTAYVQLDGVTFYATLPAAEGATS